MRPVFALMALRKGDDGADIVSVFRTCRGACDLAIQLDAQQRARGPRLVSYAVKRWDVVGDDDLLPAPPRGTMWNVIAAFISGAACMFFLSRPW